MEANMTELIKVVVFMKDSGRITSVGTTCLPELLETPEQGVLTHITADIENDYVHQGEILHKGDRPSSAHIFDYTTKQWVDPRTIDDLKASLLVQVNDARIAYSTAPIEYAGRLVDADLTAQSNINNKLLELTACRALGVDMNPDLMLWRDADNLTVTFSTMDDMERWLHGLVAKIAERGTQCYAWSWNIKAAIEAATTVDEFPTISM